MGWFVDRDTYERKIIDPESGAEADVTMRALNAGDRAEFNEIKLLSDGAGGGEGQLQPGRMQLLSVERAVLSWTIPGPQPSSEAIAQLDPRVFDQLYELVSFGNPPEAKGSEAWQKAQQKAEGEPDGKVVPLAPEKPSDEAAERAS